jgi:hypothetical protein
MTMTITIQRWWIHLGALALLAAMMCTATPAARAGDKQTLPVVMHSDHRGASGQLGDARASQLGGPGDRSSIAISVEGKPGQMWGGVSFVDAKGATAGCSTTDDAMIRALAAVPSDGFIEVTWDEDRNCTWVYGANISYGRPKTP